MAENKQEFYWVAVILTLFISMIFFLHSAFPNLFQNYTLDSSKVNLQPWTLVAYMFFHGSYNHLFSNMFALALFGSILEKIVGYKKFLFVFFFTGIIAGIASTFFYASVIGASGAIFGVMGVLTMLRPAMIVWAFGVPMNMIVAIILYAALDLGGVFYPDSIAHIGHLSALAIGLFIGIFWRGKYKVARKKEENKPILSEEELAEWEDKYMKKKAVET